MRFELSAHNKVIDKHFTGHPPRLRDDPSRSFSDLRRSEKLEAVGGGDKEGEIQPVDLLTSV